MTSGNSTVDEEESNPTVIDLFCGAGGFTALADEAGYDVVGGVDHNETALETFEANHDAPGVQADLFEEGPVSVLERVGVEPGDVDVVVGGPPCKGFSIAGERDPDDERNELVREYYEFVEYIDPSVFIMENVSGLLSMEDGAVIDWVVERAEGLGYDVEYEVLNAARYGVPQTRERLFVIGSKTGSPSFPEPTHAPPEEVNGDA